MMIRNALFNILGLAVSVVVGLVVSPIVVKSLGNTLYGIWVLIVSLTSQMGLLDLGVQSAVLRYVAKYINLRDHDRLNRLVTTATLLFGIAGAVAAVATGVISIFFGRLFHIPPEILSESLIALWFVGIGIAVAFPLTVYNGVLAGLQRYDLLNIINIVSLVGRSIGVVLVLRWGYGIAAVAAVQVTASILGRIATTWMAFKYCPELRLRWNDANRETAREIFGYASFAFIIHVAVQLSFYADSIVIGLFLSAGAVTIFAIAGNIIEYLRQILGSVTRILNPVAASLDAVQDKTGLRKLLVLGTRNTLIIALPLIWFFGTRGPEFISLWMGREFRETSGLVLQILLIGQIAAFSQFTADNILYGISQHRYNAKLHTIEGLSNLALSLLLVRPFGVYGVAIGTTIPLLVCKGFLLPRYVARATGTPVRALVLEAYRPAFVCSLPFALVVAAMWKWIPASSLSVFLGQTVLLFSAYAIWVWFFGLDRESKEALSSWRVAFRPSP